jgi:hypothetical protein
MSDPRLAAAFEPFSREHYAGIFRDLLEQAAGFRTTI